MMRSLFKPGKSLLPGDATDIILANKSKAVPLATAARQESPKRLIASQTSAAVQRTPTDTLSMAKRGKRAMAIAKCNAADFEDSPVCARLAKIGSASKRTTS